MQTRWSLLSRLKDLDDRKSWREFFDRYWRLIYGVAVKSGLNDAEAQEVVQGTLISVARKIGDFKTDPARGKFKSWLLNATRWRIKDQVRKRMPNARAIHPHEAPEARTGTVERIPDPPGSDLETMWEQEWARNLLAVARERVKSNVSPQDYQIFDLCAVRQVPAKKVADKLGIRLWKVYFAQKRVAHQLRKEMERLEDRLL